MSPAPKANTAPPSPFLQDATSPDSPPRLSPLWNADEDNRKQVVVDAIQRVLADEASAPPPVNANQLARLLEAIMDFTSRSSKSTIADVVPPPNTPRTSQLEIMPKVEAEEPIGQMVPSPINPRAYTDWTSAAADHHLRDGAQTNIIPDCASEPVTMAQLKELFMALLELKSRPPAPPVFVPEDIEGAAAQAAAEARFKKVMEMYAFLDMALDNLG